MFTPKLKRQRYFIQMELAIEGNTADYAELPSVKDSPMFWDFVENAIARAEKLNGDSKHHVKRYSSFYNSNVDKIASSGVDGWKSFRNILEDVGARDFDKHCSTMLALTRLRITLKDEKMNALFFTKVANFVVDDVTRVRSNVAEYDDSLAPYLRDQKKFLGTKLDQIPQESAVKTEQLLQEHRKLLQSHRLDIGSQMEILGDTIRLRALDALRDCFHVHLEYFRACMDILENFKGELESLESTIHEVKESIEQRHVDRSIQQIELSRNHEEEEKEVEPQSEGYGVRDLDVRHETSSKTSMEGHLYLVKTDGNVQIKRAWVVVDSGKIFIQRKKKSVKTVELLLCTVKEARENNLRYCFQIISPKEKFTLQAIYHMNEWMTVIRNVISSALNNQNEGKSDVYDRDRLADLMLLREIESNNKCADCGAEEPEWLSKNLSIMICKSCSGFHRSLGTHISKVRSALLDKIDRGLIEYIRMVGNANANRVHLAGFPDDYKIPTIDTPPVEMKEFIIAKYSEHQWIAPVDPNVDINTELMNAVSKKNINTAYYYIAVGANVNIQFGDEFEGRCPLHESINSVNFAMTVMLLENGAALDVCDQRGWTPMHYAVYRDQEEIIRLLLGWNAPTNVMDDWGFDPLSLALKYECDNAILILQTQEALTSRTVMRGQPKGFSFQQNLGLGINLRESHTVQSYAYKDEIRFDTFSEQEEERPIEMALGGLVQKKTMFGSIFGGMKKKKK